LTSVIEVISTPVVLVAFFEREVIIKPGFHTISDTNGFKNLPASRPMVFGVILEVSFVKSTVFRKSSGK
jgi:hypothetical protein